MALNPSQLHELVANLVPDNNNNLVEPTHVRQVLDEIIDSVYNLVSTPNPTAPSLDNVLVEGNESGAKDLLMTTGRYLIFRDGTNNLIRLRPVAQPLSAGTTKDIVLPAKAGTLALLSDIAASSWLLPVEDEVAQPTGLETAGTRLLVSASATGIFTGQEGKVAVRTASGWELHDTADGDMVRVMTDASGVVRSKESGVWVTPQGLDEVPSLANVLATGNSSGVRDVVMDDGQAVAFASADGEQQVRLKPSSVTANALVTLPDVTGQLALISDLMNLRLQDVLVAGTETAGRSISISENDGINFLQGANQVRVKPQALTANRNLALPDKNGTVALMEDLDGVVAMIDGTMRAPEAYTPTGDYPTTYGGEPIQRGDTFRVAAGTMGETTVNAEDLLIALADAPGQLDAAWQVIESNRVVATQVEAEDEGSEDLVKLMPPKRWWQAWTKGLTLAAFGAAVRGVLLDGYTAGSNAAVVAGDSVFGALRKLQGQVTARAARSANLSDLSNAGAARSNLGLRGYATEDFADALVARVMMGRGEGVEGGHLVVLGTDGKYHLATPGNAIDARVGIVIEDSGGGDVRVQFGGIAYQFTAVYSQSVDPGVDYWLSGDNAGGITSVRPRGHAIYVGRGWMGGVMDFRPAQAVQSGWAKLDSSVDVTNTGDTGLRTMDLAPGGTYEVSLLGQVMAESPAGRAKVFFGGTGVARGELRYSASSSDDSAILQLLLHDALQKDTDNTSLMEDEPIEVRLTATVIVDEHHEGGITVMLSPLVATERVHLLGGAILTWNRIG